MFDQTFVNAHGQTHRPWTVAISLALQTALIAVLLIVPLLHVATLDLPLKIPVLLPIERVNLKLKPEPKAAPHSSPAARPVFHLAAQRPPTAIPTRINLAPDAPEIGNVPVTSGLGVPSFGDALLPETAIAPPPVHVPAVKSPPPSPAEPIRIGSGVQSAKLIFGPKPAYPPLARTTRTQGTVRIQAIIARDGSIGHLQVLSGPPLLIEVAIEAVRQWRYRPTLLNGEPVEVITEIDVNFKLSQ